MGLKMERSTPMLIDSGVSGMDVSTCSVPRFAEFMKRAARGRYASALLDLT